MPNGVRHATTSLVVIRAWWANAPLANPALATGELSGVVVLDVDGDEGRASLDQLEHERGSLPLTQRVRTGSGEHVYFEYPRTHLKNTASKLGAGLDVRCCGGYVVTVGAVHRSGHVYVWTEGHRPAQAPIAEMPHWLVEQLTRPRLQPSMRRAGLHTGYASAALASEEMQLLQTPIGNRNARLNVAAFRLARFISTGALSQSDVETVLFDAATRLGLSEREARATISSGLRAGTSRELSSSHKLDPPEAGASIVPVRSGEHTSAGASTFKRRTPLVRSIAHLAQAIPSPVPGPVATPSPGGSSGASGSGPSIDLGPILSALNPDRLFGNFLLLLAQQLAGALAKIWNNIWHSGANIFTFSAPALTCQFGPVAGLAAGMHLLIAAITALGVVMAAASLAGRQVFGWGGDLGEHLGRLGLAATLANGAPILISTAIDWNNTLCEAIGAASVPPGFDGSPIFDNLTTGLLMVFVLWFGLHLGLKMLYRIGLLWILIVTAPLALACWAVPQAQWVATRWTRQFVGWTFGQVMVTIALKLAFENGPFGAGGSSEMGMVFSGVMMVLATDLVDLLAYGSVPRFSVLRGANVVYRGASAIGMTFVNSVPRAAALATQRRLPGF